MRDLSELGERTGRALAWPLRAAASISSASSKIGGPSPREASAARSATARASS